MVSVNGFSQLDSSKINFYNDAPDWQSEMDEILYPVDSYKEYFLEIDLGALSDTENLHFELTASDSKTIVLKKSFSKSNLITNFSSGNNIIISLGNLEIIDYKLFITQEKLNKEADYVISKTIAQ